MFSVTCPNPFSQPWGSSLPSSKHTEGTGFYYSECSFCHLLAYVLSLCKSGRKSWRVNIPGAILSQWQMKGGWWINTRFFLLREEREFGGRECAVYQSFLRGTEPQLLAAVIHLLWALLPSLCHLLHSFLASYPKHNTLPSNPGFRDTFTWKQ